MSAWERLLFLDRDCMNSMVVDFESRAPRVRECGAC